MTVQQLLKNVSASEISEWMAFDSIDPIGAERGDLRAGIIASTVANTSGGKKDGDAFKPADFMPYLEKPKDDPVAKFRASLAHLVKAE